jgi:polar amino acid transport system substrate-binding protein
MMRRFVIAVAAFGLILAACAKDNPSVGAGGTTGTSGASGSSGAASCSKDSLNLVTPGTLTIATDSPAFNPWFRHNDPANGQGYESAVAYAVAEGLGFTPDQVTWVVEPFNRSYAPGPKNFDFDINQVSITPERAQVVDFSHGYYDDQQALIAIKGTPIASATTLAELKQYKFGAQVGTTSLQFITQVIGGQYAVFDTTNDAKSALEAGQIDGLILDLPTASYTQYSVKDATLVGKFASTGEQFGLLFQKGNSLVACVNPVIDKLRTEGTLDELAARWLQNFLSVPLIQ